jgi:PAS domain-containing protein
MLREVRVAHVELSLSGAFVPQARTPSESEFVPSIERWKATVASAAEPALVIDRAGTILAVSPSAAALLGLGRPAETVGQPLLGGAVRLIDFTAGGGELLAISSGRLARGLMRVQTAEGDAHLTVDAIATPLTDAGDVVASLTFFSAVR